jgi:hypothetical protein
MAETFVQKMLRRQYRRAQAIIMGHAERTFYDKLDGDEKAEFRKVVLGAISSYHEACLDLVEASVDTGMEINHAAIEVIAQFNENVQKHRDELRGLVKSG